MGYEEEDQESPANSSTQHNNQLTAIWQGSAGAIAARMPQ